MNDFIKNVMVIKDEVKEALNNNVPVVALESTIITHGMPFPKNIETALEVEEIIREGGAIPATIAILDGTIRVGLSKNEIEDLANRSQVVKASRRDLPIILANKMNGATTVAGTMIISALAGIKIFVTGGIGGVHRGAETTMDISADLEELATTNVAVVCAGAKSILDIGLTLEYLETKGVPVLGLRTGDFPAFYTRESGFPVDYKIEDEETMAKMIDTKWKLGLNGGIVVANPIPKEYALNSDYINGAIEKAILEAENSGVKGKKITPFLLGKLEELTEGKSLAANVELVKNNARAGAKIAKALTILNQ